MPDFILRWKIRNGLTVLMVKMDKEEKDYKERVRLEVDFVKEIKESPIAIHQEDANEQHMKFQRSFSALSLVLA